MNVSESCRQHSAVEWLGDSTRAKRREVSHQCYRTISSLETHTAVKECRDRPVMLSTDPCQCLKLDNKEGWAALTRRKSLRALLSTLADCITSQATVRRLSSSSIP